MNPASLSALSTEQLVDRFVKLGLQQHEAMEDDKISKYNRLYMDMVKLVDELKSRAGDQRHALLPLYHHQNVQVRMRAAKSTFALAPLEARHVLEAISDSNWYPYAADARGMLSAIDEGSYRPE